MRTQDIFIKGLGVYLPEIVSTERAAQQGKYPTEQLDPEGLTGAAVAGDMPAPEMALLAAQDAFKRCQHRPDEVDLLLYADTWHQGPEGWLPCCYLQHNLVGGDVLSFELRQGCSGVFGAMELAAGYLYSSPERQAALLVAADNYGTPLMDRWRVSEAFITGDAACALVLTKEQGFAQLLSVRLVTVPEVQEISQAHEPIFPPSITLGQTADFRARRDIIMRDPESMAAAAGAMIKVQQKMRAMVDTCLTEAGVALGDITRVAFPHAGREVVDNRGMSALGLDMSKSTWEFGRTVGHCGASDQILAFNHLLAAGELRPGDHFMMLGTGPGVVLSCAIIKIIDEPSWAR